jgi:hypothetical protein
LQRILKNRSYASYAQQYFQVLQALFDASSSMTKRNTELGLSAFNRIAAFACIRAKQGKWADEQEYRHATIIRQGAVIEPNERCSKGKVIRYLRVEVRKCHKRIALAEIIIGPNQDSFHANELINKMLADAGYQVDSMDYPIIINSTLTPWVLEQQVNVTC